MKLSALLSVVVSVLLLASNAHGQADALFSEGDFAVTKEEVKLKPKENWSSDDDFKMLEADQALEVLDAGITGVKVRVDSTTTGWVYYRKLLTVDEAEQGRTDREWRREEAKRAAERKAKRRREARKREQERRREAARREKEREREAQEAAEKYMQELRAKGYSIALTGFSFGTNSAGGVSPAVSFLNINEEKKIKYIFFTLAPYNSVGDPVRSTVGSESAKTVKGIGPVEPFEKASYEFSNIWYNDVIDCVEVHKIRVEFLNGSSFVYINDLKDIIKAAPGIRLRGDCDL